MSRLFAWMDRFTERGLRGVAHRHGRRSLLGKVGVALVGGSPVPDQCLLQIPCDAASLRMQTGQRTLRGGHALLGRQQEPGGRLLVVPGQTVSRGLQHHRGQSFKIGKKR